MNNYSVGATMQDQKNRALKTLAITAGVFVYVGMLAYSAVHNLSLLTRGIKPEMVIWAALGVIALELSAAALPVALHWWTHSPMQRLAAFAFYGLDVALILLNVILDFALTSGAIMPAWLSTYLFYAVPVTPVISGLGWSVLFLLDPSQRERAMTETLRASTRETLAGRIAQAAKAADISESVEAAANELARQIVADTLGIATEHTHQRTPALSSNAGINRIPPAVIQPITVDPPQQWSVITPTQAAPEPLAMAEAANHPNGHKPGATGQQ